jgi:hypothetical protein
MSLFSTSIVVEKTDTRKFYLCRAARPESGLLRQKAIYVVQVQLEKAGIRLAAVLSEALK